MVCRGWPKSPKPNTSFTLRIFKGSPNPPALPGTDGGAATAQHEISATTKIKALRNKGSLSKEAEIAFKSYYAIENSAVNRKY